MSSDKENTNLRSHQFDGIQEYDNQLPRWWLYGFYISILFSVGYLYWFEFGGSGMNLADSLMRDQQYELERLQANAPQKKQMTEEELLVMYNNPEIQKKGQQQYATKCVSCHGVEGEGIVGPNLTDHYFIHGNKMLDMVKVITEGVLAKGMPTWSTLMTEEEIVAAAAYVKSLEGKTVKNPKKSEGSLISP